MHESTKALSTRQDRLWKIAAAVFILGATAIALTTVAQYGATWDEEHSMTQGDLMLRWYTSGFQDRGVIDVGNYRLYGGFVNAIVQLAHRSGAPLYTASHVVSSLFGLIGLIFAYQIGSALSSPLGGCLSAVFLWLTPMYYGQSFNNPKDLPFAVLSLASFGGILWCWRHLPVLPARVWLPTAVLIGLTMAIRVAGVLSIAYLALSWLIWLAVIRERRTSLFEDVKQLTLAGGKIVLVAWALMMLFWPYAQVAPLHGPWRGLLASKYFNDWVATVRFQGADVFSNELPRTYVPIWFGITLPEFYFIAVGLAIAALWMTTRRRRLADLDRTTVVFVLLLALTIVFPAFSVIYSRSILYDGVRHLLFVVPPLAVIAGVATASFFGLARGRWIVGLVAVALVVSLAATAIDMWRLHPYESVYFNRISGGLRGAAGRFETDYWGQSYREGTEWLVAHYARANPSPIRVANCSSQFLTGYYLERTPQGRARFESVDIHDNPDVVLATTRWSCQERIAGRILHVVERMGTPLSYVIEVDRAHFTVPILGQR